MKEGQSGAGKSPGFFPYPKEWLGPESEDIAESIRKWADSEVIGKRLQFRENFEYQMTSLRMLANDIGLHRLIWPEEFGGAGFPLRDAPSTLRGRDDVRRQGER